MNITNDIGLELGVEVFEFLKKTPEIQVYANANVNRYQWRDSRFKDTSDTWRNEDYASRNEVKDALMKHLKLVKDF